MKILATIILFSAALMVAPIAYAGEVPDWRAWDLRASDNPGCKELHAYPNKVFCPGNLVPGRLHFKVVEKKKILRELNVSDEVSALPPTRSKE